jgi:hypothetical protein
MHQSFEDEYKKFAVGDIVVLDNGMPEFEKIVGVGVVVKLGPGEDLGTGEVVVHWQNNVWTSGRQQKMSACEIRHAALP